MKADKLLAAALLAILCSFTAGGAEFLARAGAFGNLHAARAGQADTRRVARVVDGDTIVLYPNEKVRLIGVDAPETSHPRKGVECFGEAAKKFTLSAVNDKPVRLAFEDANAFRGHRDKYGRTLGYIYLADGMFLNAELIRRGYAHAYTRFPFRFIVEFRELERQARSEGLGLWWSCANLPVKMKRR